MLISTKKDKEATRDRLTEEGLIKQNHFARLVMIPRPDTMDGSGYNVFIDVDCFHCKGTGYQRINHKRKDKKICNCVRYMNDTIHIRYLKVPKASGTDHKHTKKGN